MDSLEKTITLIDQEIEEYCRPFEEAVVLLDTIPSIAREIAEIIVSEIGTDMSRFPTANHIASWAGVAPGNNESAGKHRSGRTTNGIKSLGVALVQAVHYATHTKNTYLSAKYHRLAGRRGKKRATVAVAHTILVIAYYLLKRKDLNRVLGGNYFDNCRPEATARRMVRRLESLGYLVSLQQLSDQPHA